ncbi:MAG: DUF2461 domain-containing protein [Chlorobi bacterium]|nr:DUF2461 domain-containing protein [Chlorobiota bacterium]
MDRIILDFLHALKENNNRDWFNAHKKEYEAARSEMEQFVDGLIADIRGFEPSLGSLTAKQTMFRIYRDIRFSKDKTPYKTWFGAYIAPGGRKSEKAGYYLQIDPDECFAAGGAYRPQSAHLKMIRSEIYYNLGEFLEIIENKDFKKTFGELQGERLKRPPLGFPKDFVGIEWLKFKDYIMYAPLTEKQIIVPGFGIKILEIFRKMKPMNDFLNRAMEMGDV